MAIGHQSLGYKCSRTLTNIMGEQKVSMNKLHYQTIEHDGVCYKNTISGPSIAEDLACVEVAEIILNNEYGNSLPDSEAIFGEEIIIDGDTRGCMKFIAK